MYDVFYADRSFDRARNELPRRAERGAYAVDLIDRTTYLARGGRWVDAATVPARFRVGQRVRHGAQIAIIVAVQPATATLDYGRGVVATANQAYLRAA